MVAMVLWPIGQRPRIAASASRFNSRSATLVISTPAMLRVPVTCPMACASIEGLLTNEVCGHCNGLQPKKYNVIQALVHERNGRTATGHVGSGHGTNGRGRDSL